MNLYQAEKKFNVEFMKNLTLDVSKRYIYYLFKNIISTFGV